MFGDIALNQSGGRTASIICESQCYMFELTVEDYNEALKALIQKEKSDKYMLILQSLPTMQQKIEDISFERTVYSIKETTFQLGETILAEGCRSDRIYLIKEGQCHIKKHISDQLFEELLEKKLYPASLEGNFNRFKAYKNTIMNSKTILRNFCLSIANTGEIIGCEAALSDPFKSRFTYIADSQPTIVYYISKEDFLKHFSLVLKETVEANNKLYNIRLKSLAQRLELICSIGNCSQ